MGSLAGYCESFLERKEKEDCGEGAEIKIGELTSFEENIENVVLLQMKTMKTRKRWVFVYDYKSSKSFHRRETCVVKKIKFRSGNVLLRSYLVFLTMPREKDNAF